MVRRVLYILAISSGVLLTAVLVPASSQTRNGGIPIQPVTPGTMELMRELSTEVKTMEGEVQRVTTQLKNMWETFQEHGCEQAMKEDCETLLDGIRLKYKDFLTAVSDSVQPVEEKFQKTLVAYEHNLKNYRGKTTLTQLWNQAADTRTPNATQAPHRRRKWAGTLWGLYNLLTAFGTKSSIAKATDLYEELKAVEEPLMLIRQEIETQRASPELDNFDLFRTDYGKFEETFQGIQAFIFEENEPPLPLQATPGSAQPSPKQNRWMR